jgi:hypothetical protein
MTRKWLPLFVVVGGLGLWGLSELFPPWRYLDGNTSQSRSAGYHFYKSPPALKSPAEMKQLFDRRDDEIPLSIQVRRNYLQSIAQRMVLAWLTLNAFILSFGRGPLLLRVLLWMFVAFGGGRCAAFFGTFSPDNAPGHLSLIPLRRLTVVS